MLSKSLMQLSVDGWGCVPFLQFGLRPNYVKVVVVMGAPSKGLRLACAAAPRTTVFSVLDPTAGHCPPTPPRRLLDTHKQVWLSLLWGHSSFLLGPGAHKVLFVPWNAQVESQEIPGVAGKFGLGIQNKAGQRLTEFCQENPLVIENTLFQ